MSARPAGTAPDARGRRPWTREKKVGAVGRVLAALLMGVGIATEDGRSGGHFEGSVPVLLFLLGCMVAAAAACDTAWRRSSIHEAVYAAGTLLSGAVYAMLYVAAPRPGWLTMTAVAMLVGSLAFVVPLTIAVWRRTHDERERLIAGTASAIAFATSMGVVIFVAIAKEYLTALDLDLTLLLVVVMGVASWVGSFLLLRSRM